MRGVVVGCITMPKVVVANMVIRLSPNHRWRRQRLRSLYPTTRKLDGGWWADGHDL
jgi:hypothetical protein